MSKRYFGNQIRLQIECTPYSSQNYFSSAFQSQKCWQSLEGNYYSHELRDSPFLLVFKEVLFSFHFHLMTARDFTELFCLYIQFIVSIGKYSLELIDLHYLLIHSTPCYIPGRLVYVANVFSSPSFSYFSRFFHVSKQKLYANRCHPSALV